MFFKHWILTIGVSLSFVSQSFGANPVPPPLGEFPHIGQKIPQGGGTYQIAPPKPKANPDLNTKRCAVTEQKHVLPKLTPKAMSVTIPLNKGWQKCMELIQADGWLDYDLEHSCIILKISENMELDARKGSLEIWGGLGSKVVIEIQQPAYENMYRLVE